MQKSEFLMRRLKLKIAYLFKHHFTIYPHDGLHFVQKAYHVYMKVGIQGFIMDLLADKLLNFREDSNL